MAQVQFSGSSIDSITYLTGDQIGSPRLGTNQSQDIVWRWDSDAFGSVEPLTDPDGDGVHVNVENRFAGQYADAESGLRYNWHRYYDAGKGRYISSDPIGLAGGVNTFGYVGGNPVGFVDLWGLHDSSHLDPDTHTHDHDLGGETYAETSAKDGSVKFGKEWDKLNRDCPSCADAVDYHESVHQDEFKTDRWDRPEKETWKDEFDYIEDKLDEMPDGPEKEKFQDWYDENQELYDEMFPDDPPIPDDKKRDC